jgi:hypothetical protein
MSFAPFRDGDTYSTYVFVKDTDPGREIVITTLLFDIPEQP